MLVRVGARNLKVQRGIALHGLSSGGLPLFMGLSDNGAFEGFAGPGIARGSGDNIGNWRINLGEEGVNRVDQGAHDFAGRHGRGLQRIVIIEHPAGEHGFRSFLNPLVDERGDFVSQVRGVIEAGEFKALQGGARRCLQVIEGRSESGNGHDWLQLLLGPAQYIRPMQ